MRIHLIKWNDIYVCIERDRDKELCYRWSSTSVTVIYQATNFCVNASKRVKMVVSFEYNTMVTYNSDFLSVKNCHMKFMFLPVFLILDTSYLSMISYKSSPYMLFPTDERSPWFKRDWRSGCCAC